MKPLTKFQCGASHVVLAFVLVLKRMSNFIFFIIKTVVCIMLQWIDSSDIFKTAMILVMSAQHTSEIVHGIKTSCI